jgi:hypothetical protein
MSSGEEREADGWVKLPICPIKGRITGNGASGAGWNETWRKGEVLMIVWIVVRE